MAKINIACAAIAAATLMTACCDGKKCDNKNCAEHKNEACKEEVCKNKCCNESAEKDAVVKTETLDAAAPAQDVKPAVEAPKDPAEVLISVNGEKLTRGEAEAEAAKVIEAQLAQAPAEQKQQMEQMKPMMNFIKVRGTTLTEVPHTIILLLLILQTENNVQSEDLL